MRYQNILLTIIAITLFHGCVKDTLDKSPKLSFSEDNAFDNFEIIQTYALGFYTIFPGYNLGPVNNGFNGDLMMQNNSSQGSDWIWNRITVPTSSGNWDFSFVRRVNLMLDNIEDSQMSEAEINHWKSVGYFFRAFDYMDKISKFGDVPWIDHVLTDGDEEDLYGLRTPRDEVADHILNDLLFAKDNIMEPGTNGIVENSISSDVVRAAISRFGLAEGTWRKYHGLNNAEKYLRASADAALGLMENNPDLHPNYDEVFNSADLSGVAGILLYKQYEEGVLTHVLTSRHRNSAGNWDLTKKAADMYLMKDGMTRWNSLLFDGDKNPYDEFRNRDRRLLYTVTPPFRASRVPNDRFVWDYDENIKHREYIDLFMEISNPLQKELPTRNHRGFVLYNAPHFRDFNEGIPYNVSRTGYKLFKYYDRLSNIQNQDFADSPIFRMGEILVNYAEAKWELDEFDQNVADQTINKLRQRGQVDPMAISDIDGNFDPTRDPEIDPLLWEIRRERALELMAEGFRFDDLRRWKKMDYTDNAKLGRWIKSADVNGMVPIENDEEEGYISYFGTPPAWEEYMYLYPIPSNDIVLNPKLEQNPGW